MKIFSTPRQLPFLQLITLEQGMQLQVNNMPVQASLPPFETWFRTIDVSRVARYAKSRSIASVMLGNEIARETRRGAGNILFVPDLDTKGWFENSNGCLFERIIINRDLQPTELRCAYWKMWSDKIVDGGVQFSPDGFSCLPNYSAYFTRCFL